MTDIQLPPLRELPPGRLDDRRQHLLAEICRPTPSRLLGGGRRRYLLAAVAVGLAAIVGPALALNANVRQLVGLSRPLPMLSKARLEVSAPAPHGQVIRLYTAPTREGGVCEFIHVAAAGSRPAPRFDGAAECATTKGAKLHSTRSPFEVGLSSEREPDGPRTRTWIATIVYGWISPRLHATRVQLEWGRGRQRLTFGHDYFLAATPVLFGPPFGDLPFAIVAYNAKGAVVARSKLNNKNLYLDWRQDRIPSKLRAYRLLHRGSPQTRPQAPAWLTTRIRGILGTQFARARLVALDYIDYPSKTAVILEFERPVNVSGRRSRIVRLSYDRRTHERAKTIRSCTTRRACLRR